MITLLSVLVILSVLGVVASVAAVISDGYRPIRTDWSRVPRRSPEKEMPTEVEEPVGGHADPAVHVVEPRRRSLHKAPRAAHRLP